MKQRYSKVIISIFCLIVNSSAYAQLVLNGQDTSYRVITTAVPFLTIAPDARAAGMGDVGAATNADVNATYWNPAKLVYTKTDKGISLSYTPWLRRILSGMSVSYLSAYTKLDDKQAIAVALNYFNLGNLSLKDNSGQGAGEFRPREFAIATTYSRKLSEVLSMAATLRYIYSDIYGNLTTGNGVSSQAGNAVAGDLGMYFRTSPPEVSTPVQFAFGAVVSNMGTQISYGFGQKNYLPANLRIGTQVGFTLGFNQINLAVDLNKWLVPTPPVYKTRNGVVERTADGRPIILHGKDPNRSYLSSVFGSFTDAPGGISEEIHEIMFSVGGEYIFNDMFMFRMGYFYESPSKGGREYLSLGAGAQLKSIGLDLAYLVPFQQNNPLGETIRFSLHLDIGDEFKPTEDKTRTNKNKRNPNTKKQRPPQYKNKHIKRR
ncbi:type IX secretion system outer membrane channel protein PorV [Xanthocytophaga agilis]|uniref:Type IX secretion system outer membrane channel protein PorV n=1 Tax=Xanthocytophaga agilis TaxID=3048010 RepID=A0AAE3QWW6_9BACT|nr:type IX secretion system outer membrane channel protein PorV [Xanthocytophaga agilis]MDJ1499541.1 type IX secretion system outer membrane channel protein PorV [Xanthocytophaga agilis]